MECPNYGELTAIGHHCREALQLSAESLTSQCATLGVASDKTKAIARIRAVLMSRVRPESDRAFLDSLFSNWGTVNDLIQRQEHGASREGESLQSSDVRRVVFQTLISIYETIKRSRRPRNHQQLLNAPELTAIKRSSFRSLFI